MLGSAAMIVMDDTTDMVWVAENLIHFYKHESCGKCTPCREGADWMHKILQKILRGDGASRDIDLLLSVAEQHRGQDAVPVRRRGDRAGAQHHPALPRRVRVPTSARGTAGCRWPGGAPGGGGHTLSGRCPSVGHPSRRVPVRPLRGGRACEARVAGPLISNVRPLGLVDGSSTHRPTRRRPLHVLHGPQLGRRAGVDGAEGRGLAAGPAGPVPRGAVGHAPAGGRHPQAVDEGGAAAEGGRYVPLLPGADPLGHGGVRGLRRRALGRRDHVLRPAAGADQAAGGRRQRRGAGRSSPSRRWASTASCWPAGARTRSTRCSEGCARRRR